MDHDAVKSPTKLKGARLLRYGSLLCLPLCIILMLEIAEITMPYELLYVCIFLFALGVMLTSIAWVYILRESRRDGS
jgi:hypothetical protein